MLTARVAIIGGGLSGLYAAALLEERGVRDYVLLEGRDTWGGRLLSVSPATCADAAGPQAGTGHFDLGATWFWPDLQPDLQRLVAQQVTWTMDLWPPHRYAATFLAQAAVAAVSMLILLGIQLPKSTAAELACGRPLAAIVLQPRFIAAAISGAVSSMLMNFLMTAAPLAIHICGHSQESANLGLQWHVIAMYAPSFFTGNLIGRFGASRVATVGLALTGLSAVVTLGGIEVMRFWWMLILLGPGWNFGFLGASAQVLECHRPEERTRVQSLNDFIVFGLMAVGSLSSRGLLSAYGWSTVLWVSFLPLALSVVALALAMRKKSSAVA